MYLADLNNQMDLCRPPQGADSLEKTLMLGKIGKAGGEGVDTG